MEQRSHSTVVRSVRASTRTFATRAVALGLGGVVFFGLLSLLRLEHAAVACGSIAELLAFVCGILGWSHRSARAVVFAQLAVLALFAASIVFYFSLGRVG